MEKEKNAEEKGGTYFLLWRRRKRRELFGEGKYFFAEEKKYGEGNGGKYHGEGKIVAVGRKLKALCIEVFADIKTWFSGHRR